VDLPQTLNAFALAAIQPECAWLLPVWLLGDIFWFIQIGIFRLKPDNFVVFLPFS
jgi:hypothetical protein